MLLEDLRTASVDKSFDVLREKCFSVFPFLTPFFRLRVDTDGFSIDVIESS